MTLWNCPPLEAFKRLKVTPNLVIDLDRWKIAHDYHRKRQNYHYNSLHLPGIVDGLGVSVIDPINQNIDQKYRDGRGIIIKPGIAIDGQGNFIIVEQPQFYRIRSNVIKETTIYLLISYQDPDILEHSSTNNNGDPAIVKEAFRIDEKYSPPNHNEIELCRIQLQPGEVQLQTARDVFFPGENELDLRWRITAKLRPQTLVKIGVCKNPNSNYIKQLNSLLNSVSSIYPYWEGENEVNDCLTKPADPNFVNSHLQEIRGMDLIYLTQPEFEDFYVNINGKKLLEEYLKIGGVLLIEADTQGTNLGELAKVKQELQQALAELQQNNALEELQEELRQEREIVSETLNQKIATISANINRFAVELNQPLQPLEDLPNHSLWTKPFLFHQLPNLQGEETISIWVGGGIIFVIGQLSSAWGLNLELALSRETIRCAQQFGVNILHFAVSRKKFTQLTGAY